jgi:GT2 family glycosyltransferase
MKKIKIVFIVLVYKNVDDIRNFLQNFYISESKIIIIDSFYNHFTSIEIEKLSKEFDADYIGIENKGYGYGNNVGVKYALENYVFDYLVISNPDIFIQKFDVNLLNNGMDSIYAPAIITKTGKAQNPYAHSYFFVFDFLSYISYKFNISFLTFIVIGANKIYREIRLLLFKWTKRTKNKIYAPHGAFIIFGRNALLKLVPLFNEKMFLYCEENHLAQLARQQQIEIFYMPCIKILHYEDGSGKMSKKISYKIKKDSYLEYIRHWYEWK